MFRWVYPYDRPPRIVLDDSIEEFEPEALAVTDTTLRDGQQGWRPLSVSEGVMIYEVLVELGERGSIVSTELFLYTSRDRELMRRIREYGARYPKPIGWIRARLEDLRLVVEEGLDETVVLASVSDYHIYYKLGTTRDKALGKYLSVVEEAMKRGIVVRCALEDATRASFERNIAPLVRGLMRLSERYGVGFRVKIADTLGLGLPFPEAKLPRGIPSLIRALRRLGLRASQIEFHGHNDLGLVVANHLAAWLYGAGLSNCTLAGIGERAGNCPLEVMLIHYVGLTGRSDTVNLRALPRITEVLEKLGYRVPQHQPLLGENAFTTKAGIHIDGLLKNPEIYLPFDPSIVGRRASIGITAYGGRSAILAWLRSRLPRRAAEELDKNDPRVEAVYREVIRIYEKGRRSPLTDSEMKAIARRFFPELA